MLPSIGYLLIGLVESHYLGRPSHLTSPHWIYFAGITEEYHAPQFEIAGTERNAALLNEERT
jgi:hypothetical protein